MNGKRKGRSAYLALLRLLPQVDPQLTAVAALLAACQAAVAVGLVLALGAVIRAIPDASEGHLILWIGVLGALFVLQHALVPLLDYVAGRLGRKSDGFLRRRLMTVLLAPTGIAHLENQRILDLSRQAQGVGEGQHTPCGAVAGTFRNLGTWLTVLSLSTVVALSSIPLALLVTAFLVIVRGMLVRQFTRNALHTGESTEDLRRADYHRDLSLTAAGAKELRVFGLSDWVLERFGRYWHTAMEEIWRDRRNRSHPPWTWSVPWGVLLFVVFAVTGRALVRGEVTIPEAVMTVQAAIGASSVWISNDDVQIAYGAAAVPALLELQQHLPALAQRQKTQPAPAAGEIRFEDVSFAYPGAAKPVLSGLNLTVPAGCTMALVGANGAGKTTIVKLLTRMYEPSSGRITASGTDLRDIPEQQLRRRVAVVFQDFIRYKLPAADNVGFGRLDLAADRTALDRAAHAAGATDIVEQLESGWDTVLSKEFAGGQDLSGGQWQRIAVSRALLAKDGGANILVLDEPTANLDVRAELELFDQLIGARAGATTILVSHRFSTVRRADLICVLADGGIAELGTHEQLMRQDGRYARMYRLQAARFTDTEETAE
ncbi:ABC transporter ATP-binding protein [Nonomuraea sp. NPDC050556]|uniref:ABC transporter ATP-binding protein n=1 Tax=Nonomuraea sp. NPDC050556 TaxID=3364369 RepID=UPI003795FA6E